MRHILVTKGTYCIVFILLKQLFSKCKKKKKKKEMVFRVLTKRLEWIYEKNYGNFDSWNFDEFFVRG